MKTKRIAKILAFTLVVAALLLTVALADAPTPEVTMEGTGHYYPFRCTVANLHVRSGPSMSLYGSFGQLHTDEIFWHQLDATSNGFSYGKCSEFAEISIAYDCYGVWGWVGSSYLIYSDIL